MQIHELNSYVGTPGSSDYLAVDDGSETKRVAADILGVQTEMTQAEAEAGTATGKRLVTPAVFKSAVVAIVSAITNLFVSMTDPEIILDVVVDSSTGRATSGDDMDLYNALVDLGWTSDVIVTE